MEYSHDYQILPFSAAFEHGDYGNAYESTDWDSWRYDPDQLDAVAKQLGFKHVCGSTSQAIEAGLALGFFSSYELHEIPEDLQEWVGALRSLNAGLAEAAGIYIGEGE